MVRDACLATMMLNWQWIPPDWELCFRLDLDLITGTDTKRSTSTEKTTNLVKKSSHDCSSKSK